MQKKPLRLFFIAAALLVIGFFGYVGYTAKIEADERVRRHRARLALVEALNNVVLDLPLDKNCRLDGDILYIIETANSATVYKMEDGAQDEIGVSDCEGARASLNPYDPTNGTFSAGQTWVRATYNHGVSRWEMETF